MGWSDYAIAARSKARLVSDAELIFSVDPSLCHHKIRNFFDAANLYLAAETPMEANAVARQALRPTFRQVVRCAGYNTPDGLLSSETNERDTDAPVEILPNDADERAMLKQRVAVFNAITGIKAVYNR